jgi:hypothetical protein
MSDEQQPARMRTPNSRAMRLARVVRTRPRGKFSSSVGVGGMNFYVGGIDEFSRKIVGCAAMWSLDLIDFHTRDIRARERSSIAICRSTASTRAMTKSH